MNTNHQNTLASKIYRIVKYSVIAIFVVYTLAGFVVLPLVLESMAPQKLTDLMHRKVSINDIDFNPFTLCLTVKKLMVREKNDDPFISGDQIAVNVQLFSSLFNRSLNIKSVTLDKLFIQIICASDGTFNFTDITDSLTENQNASGPDEEKETSESGLVFNVNQFKLTDSHIRYQDQKIDFKTDITPINIYLSNLTNAEHQRTEYTLSAKTSYADALNCKGAFSLVPLYIKGKLSLTDLHASRYSAYAPLYKKFVGFDIANGTVNYHTDFIYSSDNQSDPSLLLNNTDLYFKSIELTDELTGQNWLTIPALSINGASLDLAKKSLLINLVSSSGGNIYCERSRDGVLNLNRMFIKDTSDSPNQKLDQNKDQNSNPNQDIGIAEEPSLPTAPQWTVAINKIDVNNYNFKFEDRVPATPAILSLNKININVLDFSTEKNHAFKSSFSCRMGNGTLVSHGKTCLSPLSAEFGIKAHDFDLKIVQSYIDETVKLKLTNGTLNTKTIIDYLPTRKSSLIIICDLLVSDFASTDDEDENFINFKSFNVENLILNNNPVCLSMDQILLDTLQSCIIRRSDGSINLSAILKKQQTPEHKPPTTTETETPAPPPNITPDIRIHSVKIQNSGINFNDRAIQPNFISDLSHINLEIDQISFGQTTPSKLLLSGNMNQQGGLEIKGDLKPFTPADDTDIKINFDNIEMPLFSSYCGKYIGYRLKKGKLFVDLKYDINQNKLNSSNAILIDQLMLGETVDSKEAINLPLKFAIALLQNRKGEIKLNLPVKGDLDNPEFDFSETIYQVFINFIQKIVAAPFTVFESMLDDAAQLNFLDFEVGRSDLNQTHYEKLDKLLIGLYERPLLKLDIQPLADIETDRAALIDNEFENRLKQEKAKKNHDGNNPLPSLDNIIIFPDEYETYLKSAFKSSGLKGFFLSVEEMETKLKAAIVISDNQLIQLAAQRGKAVMDYILKSKKVEKERVFMLDAKIESSKDVGGNPRHRIEFSLNISE